VTFNLQQRALIESVRLKEVLQYGVATERLELHGDVVHLAG
jgi:hypothetical protein